MCLPATGTSQCHPPLSNRRSSRRTVTLPGRAPALPACTSLSDRPTAAACCMCCRSVAPWPQRYTAAHVPSPDQAGLERRCCVLRCCLLMLLLPLPLASLPAAGRPVLRMHVTCVCPSQDKGAMRRAALRCLFHVCVAGDMRLACMIPAPGPVRWTKATGRPS